MACVIACAALFSGEAFATTIPSREDILSVVPGSKEYERRLTPFDIYILKDSSGEDIGKAFITSSIPPPVVAYNGEIDMLVGVGLNGKITGVKLLGHSETQSFMDMVMSSHLLDKFIGKTPDDKFDDIDAVTGATITSEAMIEDVKSALTIVGKEASGNEKASSHRVSTKDVFKISAVILLMVMTIVSCRLPRTKILRVATLAAAFVVLGAILNSPITIGNLVDLRFSYIPRSNIPLFILMVFAFLACILRGNLYCSYLCPFGATQDAASRFKATKICPARGIESKARYMRYLILLLTVYAIVRLGSDTARTVEPFSLCFSGNPPFQIVVQTAAAISACLFVRRAWCRFFCPTGLCLDILALIGAKIRYFCISTIRGSRVKGSAG
jgi:hypothetical protein